MELVKRYVSTVRFFLPVDRKEDIGRELEANLQEHVADREAELGRPLTVQEEAELVQGFGHPYLVAMRYRPQRHLIGPLVWPAYWLAVRIALAITFVVYAFGVGALVVAGKPAGEIVRALGGYFSGALPAFGWVTLLFAIAEVIVQKCKLEEKWGREWDVQATLRASAKPEKTPKPWETVLEIALGLVFGLWFIASLDNPRLVFGFLPFPITYGPVWYAYQTEWITVVLASVALDAWKLLEPDMQRWVRRAKIVREAASVALMYVTVKSGEVIVAASRNGEQSYDGIAGVLNTLIMIGMGIGILIGAGTVVAGLIKEVRDYDRLTSTVA